MAVFSKSFFQESSPMWIFSNSTLPKRESSFRRIRLQTASSFDFVKREIEKKNDDRLQTKTDIEATGSNFFVDGNNTKEKLSQTNLFKRTTIETSEIPGVTSSAMWSGDQVHWSLKFGLQTLEHLKIIAGSIYSTWPILLLCLLRTGLRSWWSGVLLVLLD